MKILVIDDSKAARFLLRQALKKANLGHHEIEEAADGLEALKMIQNESPDLVLADWHMPRMNGFELLRIASRLIPDICFGFVTSDAAPEEQNKALDAGARFVIPKPYTPTQLRETLEPFIN